MKETKFLKLNIKNIEINKDIINARNNYYRQKFIEKRNDMHATWQLINEIIGKKNVNIDNFVMKSFNNNTLDNILSSFQTKFQENVNKIIHNCNIKTLQHAESTQQNSMFLSQTNEEEIYNIIKSLNIKKGAGADNIRPKDLKSNANVLTPIITILINRSLQTGIVPDVLKTSVIRPIYKSGSRSEYNNYRPIAILPVIEKILEEVVVRRLTNYLEKYRIINKSQFGFQKGKSINKLLGNFSNYINTSLSQNLHCLVLYIDFSKAFDTLSHDNLIRILERNGIRGNTLNWFTNYLQCRTYKVKIQNEFSGEKPTVYGVPQGSKLGPILYILYANDLLKTLEDSTNFAYADDTAIVVSHRNIYTATAIMQRQLNIAAKWCHDNGIVINAAKTKIMHIKPRHLADSSIVITFHDNDCLHKQSQATHVEKCATYIEVVKTYKYLGIYVDSNFKWKAQIDDIKKKLRKTAYTLYHLSNCATYSVLRQAYFSLAESYIRHGITAWGSAKYSKTLQKT